MDTCMADGTVTDITVTTPNLSDTSRRCAWRPCASTTQSHKPKKASATCLGGGWPVRCWPPPRGSKWEAQTARHAAGQGCGDESGMSNLGSGSPMTVRVLVIDDDRRLFELLDEFMGQNAVALDHATDGAAGLLRLSEGGYDAVFLDIMMPGLDGLSVLRRLRERSAVPVIMLTAKGDETDRVVGLELGADDYLPK